MESARKIIEHATGVAALAEEAPRLAGAIGHVPAVTASSLTDSERVGVGVVKVEAKTLASRHRHR
jgi:hypothetical protein